METHKYMLIKASLIPEEIMKQYHPADNTHMGIYIYGDKEGNVWISPIRNHCPHTTQNTPIYLCLKAVPIHTRSMGA